MNRLSFERLRAERPVCRLSTFRDAMACRAHVLDVEEPRRLFVGATVEKCDGPAPDVGGAVVAVNRTVVVGVARHRLGWSGERKALFVADAERLAPSQGMSVSTFTMLRDAAA